MSAPVPDAPPAAATHVPAPPSPAPASGAGPAPLRLGLAVLGVAAVAASTLAPGLRDAEGFLRTAWCLAFSLGAAAVVTAAVGLGRRARAAAWTALLVAGQAAALQLWNAGPTVSYQHLPTPGRFLAGADLPLTLALLVATVAVAAGLRRLPLRRLLRPTPRLAVVGAVFVLTAATLSADPAAYAAELVSASWLQATLLGAAVLAAATLPAPDAAALGRWTDRRFGAPAPDGGPQPGGPDRFAWAAAGWVLVAAAVLGAVSYGRHPHIPDEVIYLLHGRYFAEGWLAMPLPPAARAFELDLMTYDPDRWFSPVPPGWPAVLAVGVRLGAPWLVNPVLAAVNVLLGHALLRELYDRRTARVATLLLCVSPWHLFMAMNLMTHTWTLTCALAAAYCAARARRGAWLWTLPGGAAIGAVSLIRPLEGLAVAVVLGLWALRDARGRWRIAPALGLAAAAAAVGALTLPYNRAMTGDARVFPIMDYVDRTYAPGANDLGFGANRGLGWPGLDPFPGHGAIDVVVNANLNLFAVNVELLGWGAGSLLALAWLLASGRARRVDVGMALAAGVVVALHSLYWFSGGPDFGARYWYLVLVPCLALTARGLQELAAALGERGVRLAGPRVGLAAAALSLGALLCFVPWRAVDKYHHYRGMRPDVREWVEEGRFADDALVLVRGRRFPDYASAAVYNPLDARAGGPVFAWDRDADARRAVLAAFAGRPVWLVDGPSVTGAGFRIAAGPLDAGEVPAVEELPDGGP